MFPPIVLDTPNLPKKPEPAPFVQPAERRDDKAGAAIRAMLATCDVFDPLKDVIQRQAAVLVDEVTSRAQATFQKLNPPLTERERAAVEYLHKMLEPAKLGGTDRRLGYDDVEAIAKGIQDRGFKGTIARRLAPGRLNTALEKAGVQKDPKSVADATPRKVTLAELEKFGDMGKIVEARSEGLRKLGLRVEFPEGISQAAMQHLLDGKFGLPPGGKLVAIED